MTQTPSRRTVILAGGGHAHLAVLADWARAPLPGTERVLVTALTKRLCEDLASYMAEKGVRVRYLHSDIETLDRTAAGVTAALRLTPGSHMRLAIGTTVLVAPYSLYGATGSVGACQRAGFSPRVGQEASQITSIINLVAAGLGVSLVPASMQQVHSPGVVYRPILGDAPVPLLIAH